MRISAITTSIKPVFFQTKKQSQNNSPQAPFVTNQNSMHNPMYYKPIAFKGDDWETYPSKTIYPISQEQFDNMMIKFDEYIKSNKIQLTPLAQDAYKRWEAEEALTKQNKPKKQFEAPNSIRDIVAFTHSLDKDLSVDHQAIAKFLFLQADEYKNRGLTNHTISLLNLGISISLEHWLFDNNVIEALEKLAILNLQTGKPKDAIEAYKEIQLHCHSGKDAKLSFNAQLNIFDIELKQFKEKTNLSNMLKEEYQISQSAKRKANALYMIRENRFDDRNQTFNEEDLEEVQDILTGVIAGTEAINISDSDLKTVLKVVSQMPLPNLDFAPNTKTTLANDYHIKRTIGNRKLEDNEIQAIITSSNNFIKARAKKLEEKLFTDSSLTKLNDKEKAEIIVGSNFVNGSLKELVEKILNKEPEKYNKVDMHILKILSDNLYQGGFENFNEIKCGFDPIYLTLLQARTIMAQSLYGEDSDEFYQALADFGLKDKDPDRIINMAIPLIEESALLKPTKDELLSGLYARYAKYKAIDLKEEYVINQMFETQAMEVITGYLKYFDKAQNIDQSIVFDFLTFMEDMYKNPPRNNIENSFTGKVIKGFDYNLPLLKELNNHINTKEFDKSYNLLKSLNQESIALIENIVKKSPGYFQINERKYLEMKKQYAPQANQSQFRSDIDYKIKQIEQQEPIIQDIF